jgi:hypothetical protein
MSSGYHHPTICLILKPVPVLGRVTTASRLRHGPGIQRDRIHDSFSKYVPRKLINVHSAFEQTAQPAMAIENCFVRPHL